jgi:hypothetical protein
MLYRNLVYYKLPKLFDKGVQEKNSDRFQRSLIVLSLILFFGHLTLIFMTRNFSLFSQILGPRPPSYFSAIYTPFSVILFYEVFELIRILPSSITSFMSKQYEMLSLIILRGVFHEIGQFDQFDLNLENLASLKQIGLDLISSLVIFLLVVFFNRVDSCRIKQKVSEEVQNYIFIKKSFAVFLFAGLLGLFFYGMGEWFIDLYNYALGGELVRLPGVHAYFKSFFTLMVFVDIILLIISLIYTRSYDVIFRNGAFGVSTILIRLSLSSLENYGVLLAVGAVLVGLFTIMIYTYYNKSCYKQEEAPQT